MRQLSIVQILCLATAAFIAGEGLLPAQVVRQITNARTGSTGLGALDDPGTALFAISSSDPYGTNPRHAHQIFKWDPSTGAGQQITAFEDDDVEPAFLFDGQLPFAGPSVSDDGQRLAFTSRGNLTGGNADESVELFVMNAGGSGLLQLTSAASPREGRVFEYVLSGDGSRIAFISNASYLGTNSGHAHVPYAIDTDGGNLRQLGSSFSFGLSISDDGERIAFSDGSIRGINADGTNLHTIASGDYPRLSGDGSTIAFIDGGVCYGPSEIRAVNWDGTGNTLVDEAYIGNAAVGRAGPPDIADNGQTLFYTLWSLPFSGSEVFWRVWKAQRTGGGWTQISDGDSASFPGPEDCRYARVSGSGNRVAFLCEGGEPYGGPNPDSSRELYAVNANATGPRQISDGAAGDSRDADMTPDGTRVVFASGPNLLDSPGVGSQIYRVARDGSGLFRLTSFAAGTPKQPAVSDDGSTIVFASNSDPFGLNPDGLYQIFAVQEDGTGLVQLTLGNWSADDDPPPLGCFYYIPRDSDAPDISGNGSVVVFHSRADLTGQNPTHSDRIFKIAPNGTGLSQLDYGDHPRVDAAGVWVVYEREGSIYRIRSDGTGMQLLTAGHLPDLSASADRIVYERDTQPGRPDVYLYEAGEVKLLARGEAPRISRDGSWVYFYSSAAHFETNHSDVHGFYRFNVQTNTLERVGALAPCEVEPPVERARIVTNQDGALAVFWAGRDCTGQNPDGGQELYLVDRNQMARIFVSPGAVPTEVSFETVSGPVRYDVIRGDVASLQPGANNTVDLGPVTCLENDSPDAHTRGFEDAALPAAGQVHFYLFRGSVGVAAGPGSYGEGTGGAVRVAGPGGCPG